MKQQQNNRLWQVLMVCFSLATIAIFLLVIPSGSRRIPWAMRFGQDEMEAQPIDRSIKIPIGGQVFLAHANVNNRGPKTDDYIREAMSFVARYFSILDWPEDRPVEIVETDREIVITWPLPPELAAMHAYKPDYTARAFLDKKTKEVRFLTGG